MSSALGLVALYPPANCKVTENSAFLFGSPLTPGVVPGVTSCHSLDNQS